MSHIEEKEFLTGGGDFVVRDAQLQAFENAKNTNNFLNSNSNDIIGEKSIPNLRSNISKRKHIFGILEKKIADTANGGVKVNRFGMRENEMRTIMKFIHKNKDDMDKVKKSTLKYVAVNFTDIIHQMMKNNSKFNKKDNNRNMKLMNIQIQKDTQKDTVIFRLTNKITNLTNQNIRLSQINQQQAQTIRNAQNAGCKCSIL